MTEWLLPLGVTAASLTMTYLFCLRPMRKGHCGAVPQQPPGSPSGQLDRDLARARDKLTSLQDQAVIDLEPTAPGRG